MDRFKAAEEDYKMVLRITTSPPLYRLTLCQLRTLFARLQDRTAMAKYNELETRFNERLYQDSTVVIRIALEPFFEQVDKPDDSGKMPQLKKSWETRLGLAAHKWLAESLNAIKWATNASHHSTTAHFDKFEAEMLVTITTTLVAYVARSDVPATL